MQTPKVFHWSLQLGDGNTKNPVFDVQQIDFFVEKTSDPAEGRARLSLPICIECPETS